MPTTTTTTEAGRAVAENATARVARQRAEAQARRADTPTPIAGGVVVEELPADLGKPIAEKARKPQITIATTVEHRGRVFTVEAEGITLDQFCDLLDQRGYVAHQPQLLSAPVATADDLPEGWKLCHKHHAGMKQRHKQGDSWNSHNVGTKEQPIWCKGYRGPDSPGYEVD